MYYTIVYDHLSGNSWFWCIKYTYYAQSKLQTNIVHTISIQLQNKYEQRWHEAHIHIASHNSQQSIKCI